MLQTLKENDPNDEHHIVQMLDSFKFRNHMCITFELLSINMYDMIKENNFEGFDVDQVRNYAIQMLKALKYMKQLSIIHCDLKPEN